MAKVLKNKIEQFSLYILQELINLIQNAAKFIMGIFYKIEATTMIEDAMEHSYTDYDDFIKKTKANFHKVAINCWIAAGIYLLMIGISALCIIKARSNEKRIANELTDDDLFCTAQDEAQRKKT